MDTSVNPRQDLFTYANGNWFKANPIPKEKTYFGASVELVEYNLVQLRKIVEECANEVRLGNLHLRDGEGPLPPQPGSSRRVIGDLYASGMDTARIESLKFAPIEDMWQRVSSAKTREDIVRLIPTLEMDGFDTFFSFGPSQDRKDSNVYAFYFAQGGISLPDREYYLSDKFAKQLGEYRQHVAKMFELKGISEEQAMKYADTVVSIETDLARAGRSMEDRRDVQKNYNRVDTSQLDTMYSTLKLSKLMEDMGVPQTQYVVVQQPEFFDALNSLLGKRDVEDLKVFLYWKVIASYAGALHGVVEEENFDFYGRKLKGAEEQEPRWKRMVSRTTGMLGRAVDKLYVDRYFDQNALRETRQIMDDIISAMRDKISGEPWMSDETRKQALDKLDKIRIKIGYPTKLDGYDGLVTDPNDYVGNMRRIARFEWQRSMAKFSKPVDRDEWRIPVSTVNAFYSPSNNEIVFPAGILQPPYFDAKMDVSVNYGAIGAAIGHEITHGFDDQGRRFDVNGNMRDWWTPEDAKRFNALAESVVNAYGSVEALPGFKINGRQTLGENIADLGGLIIAYNALEKRLAREPSLRVNIDGFTPEQRFFIAYAQSWRELIRDDTLKLQITTDVHSPDKYRVIIPVSNFSAFDDAFPPKTEAEKIEVKKGQAGVW